MNLTLSPAAPNQLPLIHQLSLAEPWFWHIPREMVSWEFFSGYPVQWFVAADDKPRAVVSLGHVDQFNRSCALGLIVIPSERMQGVGDACDKLMKSFAFDTLGLRKVWVSVLEDNKVIIEGLKKRGWSWQGTMRDAQLIAGAWHDRLYFECLNPNEVK